MERKQRKRTSWYSEEKMNSDVVRLNISLFREIRQDKAMLEMLRTLPNVEIPRFIKEMTIIGFLETIKGNGYSLEELEKAFENQSYHLDFPPLQAYYMNQATKAEKMVLSDVKTKLTETTKQAVEAEAENNQDNGIETHSNDFNVTSSKVVDTFKAQVAPNVSGERKNTDEPTFLSRLKNSESRPTTTEEDSEIELSGF